VQNILAFESADFKLTIALMKAGNVVGEYCSKSLYEQDVELLPTIERMLKQHNLCYHQLDLIATTNGPGSFTGIRVALATAEGLSLASGVPAAAFNSLDWVVHCYLSSLTAAQDAARAGILVALESKRQDVYCQLFDKQGKALKDPNALTPAELTSYLENKEVTCIGSGCYKLKTEQIPFLSYLAEYAMPTASDLCGYAKQKVSIYGVHTFCCDPFYLRLPDVTVSRV
jgi:tRNA threonylcarbamoyladenosine biosynthesis protein TsaB